MDNKTIEKVKSGQRLHRRFAKTKKTGKEESLGYLMYESLIAGNPVFMQAIGMCPVLAVSASVLSGLGMGFVTTCVLAMSNLIISALRKYIPPQVRIVSYIIIIAVFGTVLEMVLKAYLPFLDKSLGLFIPLIVVNCIVFARAETFASKHKPLPSFFDGLLIGLSFTLALFLLSTIREILGSGSFAGLRVLPQNYSGTLLFILPPGAFISLGIIIAGIKRIIANVDKRKREREA